MRIGDLRHRIELQQVTRTADGGGGWTEVWNTIAEVYAAIWPVSASEQLQAGQQTMTVTHRIRLRYRADIASDWRVKFGSRCFAIVGRVNPNEANRTLDLLCKEAM